MWSQAKIRFVNAKKGWGELIEPVRATFAPETSVASREGSAG
jgi:hypothetical protein